jgi:hypothetical protein
MELDWPPPPLFLPIPYIPVIHEEDILLKCGDELNMKIRKSSDPSQWKKQDV